MNAERVESYGERFEFSIDTVMNEGDLSRRELFEWWLGKDPEFTCGRCDEDFNPRRSDIEEDDEILCSRCRSKAAR
jgi:DNA-directed RNA polymerase subunit RPC12/RpoP